MNLSCGSAYNSPSSWSKHTSFQARLSGTAGTSPDNEERLSTLRLPGGVAKVQPVSPDDEVELQYLTSVPRRSREQ